MNIEDSELKLQAYLDGELSGAEQAEISRLVQSDKRAQGLAAEMAAVKTLLSEYGAQPIKVPASREFYWSGIERQIRRAQDSHAPQRSQRPSWLAALSRFLVPAGALAGLVIATFITASQTGIFASKGITRLESALAGPGSFTYRDFRNGTTLVWLSYPGEKEFADYDEDSTIP